MRALRPIVLAALAAVLAPVAAGAQQPAPATSAAPAADRAAVMAAVKALFDAMRAGDSAKVRAAFQPGARLSSVVVREGKEVLVADSIEKFIRAVGTPHTEMWDERTRDETVLVDGPLAVAWTPYSFYAGSRFSHCGVNAFTLARTAEGWRVVNITDTRQRTGCPDQQPASRE